MTCTSCWDHVTRQLNIQKAIEQFEESWRVYSNDDPGLREEILLMFYKKVKEAMETF